MSNLFILEATNNSDIGLAFCYGLWGILATQSYTYYHSFPFDPLYTKITVGLVWAGTTAFIVLHEMCFHNLLLAATHRQQVDTVPATCMVATASASMMVFIVQAAFALRIYRLWKKLYIPLMCWIGASYCLASQIAFVVHVMERHIQFNKISMKYNWLLYSTYVVNALVDVIITSTLFYFLRKDRDCVQRRSTQFLNKLSLWTLETGLATSLTAVTFLILLKVDKARGPRTPFALVLISLYPFSLLGLLNGRPKPRVARTNRTQDASAIEFRAYSMATKTINLTVDASAVSTREQKDGISEVDESRSTLAAKGAQLVGNNNEIPGAEQ